MRLIFPHKAFLQKAKKTIKNQATACLVIK